MFASQRDDRRLVGDLSVSQQNNLAGRPHAGFTAQEALEQLPGPHEGHVFRYRGLPIQDVKTAFLKALKRAGLPRCRFHDLRHTFATRLVLAGVDLATVKELMGHATISTTMRYAHPSPPHKREAVARLDSSQAIHESLDVVSLPE